MFDASAMAYEQNVAATAAMVEACHEGGSMSRLSLV
jgi:fructose/tagatose bisphosphate aldolase